MLAKVLEEGLKFLGWQEGENTFCVLDVEVFESKNGDQILAIRTDVQDILVNLTVPQSWQAVNLIGIIKAANPDLSKEQILSLDVEDVKELLYGKIFSVEARKGSKGGIFLDPNSFKLREDPQHPENPNQIPF